MNKTFFLASISSFAIIVAASAFGEKYSVDEPHNHQGKVTTQELKEGWESTKSAVSEGAEKVSHAAKDAYEEIKSVVVTDDDARNTLTYSTQSSAAGMLGQPVYSPNGDRVAKVNDIILDPQGNATWVVLGDGDFTGLGKQVAFKYNTVTTLSPAGDIISTLNEDVMDNAASFSYSAEDRAAGVIVMPANSYSVANMLKGELMTPQGDAVANVDDIVFSNGKATFVVATYGSILGFGGDNISVEVDAVKLKRNDSEVDFYLSASQAKQLEALKKVALK